MRCREPGAAEDCLQVAFIRLAGLQQTPDDPVAWLATVIRNEAISIARSESRRKDREQSFAMQSPSWLEPAADRQSEFSTDEIVAALQNLSPDAREIVVAHVWNAMSFRQIAEAFKMSSSAVHRSYQKSISLMRETLGVKINAE